MGHTYDSLRSDIGIKDILDQVNVFQRKINVLDLGCGTGHPIAKAVSPLVKRYCGIDNSQPKVDAYLDNVPNAECLLLDISNIRQISGRWDLIFSWGSLCHLPIKLQKQTMVGAANLLSFEGRFLFTGGKEAGKRTGTVGEYTVHQYSMGEPAYTKFLAEQGMKLINASYSEGNNYVYIFMKIA